MTITKISYRRNVNLGNYETKHIEVESTVGPDENPQDVYSQLEAFAVECLHSKQEDQYRR